MRRVFAGLAAAALCITGAASAATVHTGAAPLASEAKVRIVTFNDFHGRLSTAIPWAYVPIAVFAPGEGICEWGMKACYGDPQQSDFETPLGGQSVPPPLGLLGAFMALSVAVFFVAYRYLTRSR